MKQSRPIRPAMAFALLALLALVAGGCERSTHGLRPFPLPTDPLVLGDGIGASVDFQAFLGSKLDAISVDANQRHSGTSSLKVTVPAVNDPTGSYSGGAFVARINRDFSSYDALTFWARASRADTLDVAGFGNDNTGTSRFEARRNAIPLTTTWAKFVIPIPAAARLASERGLFFFAEGPENGLGCDLWFDDVQFERTGAVFDPRPSMTTRTVNSFVGASVSIEGTKTIFSVGGADVTVGHMPAYLDFQSSDQAVASAAGGVIQLIGAGSSTITGSLQGIVAAGAVNINATASPPTPAPTPTLPASNVISLFSNAYTNRRVDTWSATWDVADVADLKIGGNDTKGYTIPQYAGIEITTDPTVRPALDASAMTHFHIDVFVPNGTTIRVKLVDFGANGVYDPPGTPNRDDREHELTFNPSTTPALIPGTWSALDVPFENFTNLTTRAHLAQIILSGASTAFVDNVYLHR